MVLPTWRYRIVLCVVSPLVVAHCLWRSYNDGGWRYFKQRFGFVAPDQTARIHVHAASVGEVNTVLPLVERLQALDTNVAFLITTNTPTASSIVHKQLKGNAVHAYLPLDFAWVTGRFFKRQNIQNLWIVETEIWPWLYTHAKSRSIPITIINARLSQRSNGTVAGFFEKAYRQALSNVTVLARSDNDAKRYQKRGAASEKLHTLGNLKLAQADSIKQTKQLIDTPYVLAASTHDDEELMLAQAWLQNPPDHSSEHLLVIVPRHVERGTRLLKSLNALQQDIDPALPKIAQRSLGQQPTVKSRIYLADTLGELNDWYAHASIAFIGGSLIQRGGHNVLEAARQSTAIIVGPHTYNFTEEVDALKNINAIAVAKDINELNQLIGLAITDKQWASNMGNRAHQFINTQNDMLDLYCESLLTHLRQDQ